MRILLCLLALLAGCARQPPIPQAGVVRSVCRVGPDGGPLIADRGIGGTGAPLIADRGIGGTGIVGVITGFASVCLAGEEVALPAYVTTRIDGAPAGIADLRAGQVAAVEAVSAASLLQARQIFVRHEVIGPVQASDTGMVVAGQSVVLARAAGPGVGATVGQWVAVSGLRRPDGAIEATRIDRTAPGRVLIHGVLQGIGGAVQIGTQSIRLPDGAVPAPGFPVTVTGRLLGAELIADSVQFDPAARNPAAFFGPEVTSFIVEGFAAAVPGGLFLDRGFGPGRSVTRFTRGGDGRLNAVGPGGRMPGDPGGSRPAPGGEGGGRPSPGGMGPPGGPGGGPGGGGPGSGGPGGGGPRR